MPGPRGTLSPVIAHHTHKAAAAHPGLRILLMTGYAEQRERADDLSSKIVDVVSKPFTLPDIRTAVARALAA